MKRAADGCLLAETASQLGADLHKLLMVDLNPYRMKYKGKHMSAIGTLAAEKEIFTSTSKKMFPNDIMPIFFLYLFRYLEVKI